MRLHLTQLAAGVKHEVNPSWIPAQAWNEASRVSFNTTDARPLAAVILQGIGLGGRLEAETAQASATLSQDGQLVYAALAEKVVREMGGLNKDEIAELRADIARGLVAKERAEGPIVLTPEKRQLATAPVPPKPIAKTEEIKPALPTSPDTPQRRR